MNTANLLITSALVATLAACSSKPEVTTEVPTVPSLQKQVASLEKKLEVATREAESALALNQQFKNKLPEDPVKGAAAVARVILIECVNTTVSKYMNLNKIVVSGVVGKIVRKDCREENKAFIQEVNRLDILESEKSHILYSSPLILDVATVMARKEEEYKIRELRNKAGY